MKNKRMKWSCRIYAAALFSYKLFVTAAVNRDKSKKYGKMKNFQGNFFDCVEYLIER